MIRKRGNEADDRSKILDVDAEMQGSLTFRDPVNLRINGKFEGSLDTKGSLTVGENAVIRANIKGEEITIAGKVTGDVTATRMLKVLPPARIAGDIRTPALSVVEGAVIDGRCEMSDLSLGESKRPILSADDLAKYLEVDISMVMEWANAGKLPGIRENNAWRFDRDEVDEWVANGRVR